MTRDVVLTTVIFGLLGLGMIVKATVPSLRSADTRRWLTRSALVADADADDADDRDVVESVRSAASLGAGIGALLGVAVGLAAGSTELVSAAGVQSWVVLLCAVACGVIGQAVPTFWMTLMASGPVRVARSTAPSIREFVPHPIIPLLLLILGLALLSGFGSLLLAGPADQGFGSNNVAPVWISMIILVAISVLAVIGVRRLVDRPEPAGSVEQHGLRAAVRSEQIFNLLMVGPSAALVVAVLAAGTDRWLVGGPDWFTAVVIGQLLVPPMILMLTAVAISFGLRARSRTVSAEPPIAPVQEGIS